MQTAMQTAIKDTRARRCALVVAGLTMLALFGCAGGAADNTGAGGGGPGTGSGGAASGGGGSGAGTGGAGGPVALPMVVTNLYNNQGWFGDAAVTSYFTPGSAVIRQSDSSTGPCATRPSTTLGKCVQVIYTPPAGLTPPAGGGAYVGVFWLTTLAMAHPELTPPANVGDANWGAEPGPHIVPGASKISFHAASATDGLVVTFKAGTAVDAFALPEQAETLSTAWTSRSLSLAGVSYGASVVGAFAWILKDTTKAATFYLDGIVWE